MDVRIRLNPDGREPFDNENTTDPSLPTAVKVAVYGLFTTASKLLVVTMVSPLGVGVGFGIGVGVGVGVGAGTGGTGFSIIIVVVALPLPVTVPVKR